MIPSWTAQENDRENDIKTINHPIKPTIDQLRPTDQATEDERLIVIREKSDRNKASDSSESGRITTDLTKEELTEHENKYEYRQRSEVWDQRSEIWIRG